MATDWELACSPGLQKIGVSNMSGIDMVWKVRTPTVPDRVEDLQQGAPQGAAGMTSAFNMLTCNQDLPSSPTHPSTERHLEYDDLPELQAVQGGGASPGAFQVPAGVSHQEDTWSPAPKSDLPDTTWLTELANIATSSQSPLLQSPAHNRSSPVLANSSSLHSYARPPLASSSEPSPAPARSHWRERRRLRARSESEAGISCTTSVLDEQNVGWSHSWPSTAWHCFLKGTRVRFHRRRSLQWQDVEDLCEADDRSEDERDTPCHTIKGYGSDGLKLLAHEETVSFGRSVLKLTFDPGSAGDNLLTAECSLGHPFYVKNKGWSSFHPSLTVVQHGIPCYEALLGDVCLPPGHRDAVDCNHSVVFHAFRSLDFTPLDSSAVYVLSSMARQRRASQSSGGAVSPDPEPPHGKARRRHAPVPAGPAPPTQCKRPMNAFMLFAKKYRVEYTQMYPGRDNRAISVILGDQWKKMRQEERRTFALEAKALAEEQKRLDPDCWKRRRTSSGSQPN